MAPLVSTAAMRPPLRSANHARLSGPSAMPIGSALARIPPNSVTAPPGVMRPIWSDPGSVNHRLPSAPAVMSYGAEPAGTAASKTVIVPPMVIWPIAAAALASVNHRFPSAPTVMPCGWAPAGMPAENSVTTPEGVMRPMRPARSVNQRFPSGAATISCGSLPARCRR